MKSLGFLIFGIGMGYTACNTTGWLFLLIGLIIIIFGFWGDKQENG